MASMTSLNMLNAAVSASIACPANLLLCWLIFCRTNDRMRIWSRVLLQSAIIDLIIPLMLYLIQGALLSEGENNFFIVNGPLAKLFPSSALALFHVNRFMLEFSKYAMAVQFIYRWLIVCRERELSSGHYVLFLCVPAAMGLSLVLLKQLALMQIGVDPSRCTVCPPERIPISAPLNQALTALIFLYNLAIYAVILVVNVLIWHKSRQALMPSQPQSQQISRQVGRVLIVQAAFPLALSLIPNAAFYINLLTGGSTLWLSMLLNQSWISVIFPVVTILIVGQYRRTVLQASFGRMMSSSSTINYNNVVQPMNRF